MKLAYGTTVQAILSPGCWPVAQKQACTLAILLHKKINYHSFFQVIYLRLMEKAIYEKKSNKYQVET
jgi:hypothetical protein